MEICPVRSNHNENRHLKHACVFVIHRIHGLQLLYDVTPDLQGIQIGLRILLYISIFHHMDADDRLVNLHRL